MSSNTSRGFITHLAMIAALVAPVLINSGVANAECKVQPCRDADMGLDHAANATYPTTTAAALPNVQNPAWDFDRGGHNEDSKAN